MKHLLFFILLVAFSSQLSAVSSQLSAVSGEQSFSETENLKTSKSEKGLRANDKGQKSESRKVTRSQGRKDAGAQSSEAQSSQLEVQNTSQVFNFSDSQIQKDSQVLSFSDSQILYYENQIRLADSLYKNYLPQYNFEEVKKAVEFLESENLKTSKSEKRLKAKDKRLKSESRKDAKSQSDCLYDSATAYRMSVDRCPLTVDIEFSCAKAHYYHAVGLTERDDIVGACEHYLRALEIMEFETENLRTLKSEKRSQSRKVARSQGRKDAGAQSSEAQSSQLEAQSTSQFFSFSDSQILNNPEDYEKIRFLVLTYTRLGRLFYDENYCDLAITKYRKALKYVEILENNEDKSYVLKELGNSYQLSNKLDSALYYYNESLENNSELTNRLDIEKCIAQILFYKGERDSAYVLIKNNLDKLEGYIAKYSYYQILGEMYYNDNLYDSAIKYLNLSVHAPNKHTVLASSNILTSIYDSMGNMNLKFFYDSISLSILSNNHNKSIYTAKLQNVYSEYANRKQVREIEKEKIESRKHFVKYLIIALSSALILVSIILASRHRHRMDKIMYDKIIFNMNSEIGEKNVEIENSKQTISVINNELEKITKKYNKLSDDYVSKKKEFEKELSRKVTKNDIRNFCNCENSKKILANIDNIKNSNLKINNLAVLTKEELKQLLEDADNYLNEFTATITNKYPKLNEEDLYCICLLLLNIKGPTIAALLGKEYNSVWSRIKKIYSIIGINSKENLHKIFY